MTQEVFRFSRDEFDIMARVQPGSATSARAAEHLTASGVQGKRMAALLGAYAAVGVPGLAMFEVVQRGGLKESSVCSLRASAVKQGWLLALGFTRRCEATGCDQALHRITTEGLTALQAWKARQ